MSYDFDYYSGAHIGFPLKPKRPTLSARAGAAEARAYADELENYELDLAAYEEDYTFAQSEVRRLRNEFMDKLQKDYNLTQAQFDLLWEFVSATADSLSEKYNEFDRLYDFAVAWKAIA